MRGLRRAPIIRAAHWNVHSQLVGVELMMQLGVTFAGINEGRGVVPELRELAPLRDYRLHVAEGHGSQRSAWDTPVLIRDKHDALGAGFQQVSERWKPAERVAPDRVATWAGIDHPVGSTAYVNLHLNAGPAALRGNDPGHPIVREYLESVVSVDRLLTYLRREYDHVLVGGDVNMPAELERPWSPYPMLRDNGMVVRGRGIDVLAHSRTLVPTAHQLRVLPKAKGRTDHDGLLGSWRAA